LIFSESYYYVGVVTKMLFTKKKDADQSS